MSAARPGQVLGAYVLERPLAAGGMGEVWVARHKALERMVAVKLMSTSAFGSDVLRARFEREAKACAQLRSPNVVQVFDYGIDDGIPFLVMELLEGEDLAVLHREKGRWSLEETARIVTQAARALREAHEAGIVHRDIKLSNLFVARFGAEQIVKVIDFGVARMDEPTRNKVTRVGAQIGTTSYMSPELLTGADVDHRVDIWALAVVAFRLLTGRSFVEGSSPVEIAANLAVRRWSRATDLAPDLPPAVDRIFDQAFAERIADRFQSVEALALAFESLTTRPAPSAPSPGVTVAPSAAPRLELAVTRALPDPSTSQAPPPPPPASPALSSPPHPSHPSHPPSRPHPPSSTPRVSWDPPVSSFTSPGASAWTPTPQSHYFVASPGARPASARWGFGTWLAIVAGLAVFAFFVMVATVVGLAGSAPSRSNTSTAAEASARTTSVSPRRRRRPPASPSPSSQRF